MEVTTGEPTIRESAQPHEPTVETKESFRRVLDVSPGALMIADAHGIITHANKAAKDILGVPPEALIGRRIDELPVRLVTTEGEAIPMEENPMTRALRERREILNEDLGVLTPLGELKFLLVSAVPLTDEDGCLAGVVSSFVDISERRRSQRALEESERRLRLMLDNMTDVVFLLDVQSNLIYVSPSLERYTGWIPEELMRMGPLIGFLDKFIHPEDREKILSLWKESLNGKSFSDFEFRGLTKDDRVVWFSASWSPIIDESGRLIAVQGSMRDITERVLAREATQRTVEEKRNFYRVTIAAFTGDKLEIIDEDEAAAMIANPEVSIEVPMPEDAARARAVVKEVCARHGITGEEADHFIIAVGEAVANAIRHGQGGNLLVGFDGETVWAAVVDRGPGIETLTLPRVALERGYSGKISLGMGYSIILDAAEKVWLSTSRGGTIVIMTCCPALPDKERLLEMLPDTW